MKDGAPLMALTSIAVLLAAVVLAPEQEIRIAAAADLKFAMGELAEEFEKQSRTKVNVTYGSSGNFFSQMQNGAPFDLFFSADSEYPKKLEAAGLAETGTLSEYAVGRIVIWTAADAKLDVSKRGWQTLLDAGMEKIAIANPQHAPYGQAGVRREYFASGAICAVGKCASRDCGLVPSRLAGDAGWKTMGDPSGDAPGDRTSSDRFEGRKE